MKRPLLTFILFSVALMCVTTIAAQTSPGQKDTKNAQAQENAILKEYRQAVSKIDSPTPNVTKAQIREQYETRLASFMGLEAARDAIYRSDVSTAQTTIPIKGLHLPKEISRRMAQLKVDYDRAIAANQSQAIPQPDKNAKRKELEKQYPAQVRNLIGDAQYSTWLAIRDGSDERFMKSRFGIGKEQYLKYVEIENSKNIEIAAANDSKLSPAEKQAKIQAAKDKKAASMQALLTPGQFQKWREFNTRSETRFKNRGGK